MCDSACSVFQEDRLCVCNVPDTVTGIQGKQWSGSLPLKVTEFSGGDWLSSEMRPEEINAAWSEPPCGV